MGKIVLFNREVLWDSRANSPYPGIIEATNACIATGSALCVVSNNPEPPWLRECFPRVQFAQWRSRQSGAVIADCIQRNPKISKGDFLVVGKTRDDLQMASNGGAVLLRADWTNSELRYGVPVPTPDRLVKLVRYFEATSTPWYSRCTIQQDFEVFALTIAGRTNQPNAETKAWGDNVRRHLKEGNGVNAFLLLHLLSSIYTEGSLLAPATECAWVHFPGSVSGGSDLMESYSRLVRELLGKNRRYALPTQPMLLRHTSAQKRHYGNVSRHDPLPQLSTLHVNPYYRSKLTNRTIYVLDDYTTYGLSFSVAYALLKKAGAKKVVGIAMGQFGKTCHYFPIDVNGDVFRPLVALSCHVGSSVLLKPSYYQAAQLGAYEKYLS